MSYHEKNKVKMTVGYMQEDGLVMLLRKAKYELVLELTWQGLKRAL